MYCYGYCPLFLLVNYLCNLCKQDPVARQSTLLHVLCSHLSNACSHSLCSRGKYWVSLFTGLDYWTGLLDSKFTHKISFPAQLQPPKAIVSPHLKQCPSLGHQDIYLVQCQPVYSGHPSAPNQLQAGGSLILIYAM